MWYKKGIFYLNVVLFVVVVLLAVSTLNLPGSELIRSAVAAVLAISCDTSIRPCTVNYLARFVSGAPSNVIGDSVIYEDGSARIGIGTINPQTKLHVEGGDVRFSNASGTRVYLDLVQNGVKQWGIMNPASTARLSMVEDGVYERLTIANGGNVGIGTTTPTYKLVVSDSGAAGVEISPIGGANGGGFIQTYNRATSASTAMSYYSDGHYFWVPAVGYTFSVRTNGSVMLAPLSADPTSDLQNGQMWMRQ